MRSIRVNPWRKMFHFPATRRHHIKHNPRPPPHFLHADALIIAVLGVPFFISRGIRIESVRS